MQNKQRIVNSSYHAVPYAEKEPPMDAYYRAPAMKHPYGYAVVPPHLASYAVDMWLRTFQLMKSQKQHRAQSRGPHCVRRNLVSQHLAIPEDLTIKMHKIKHTSVKLDLMKSIAQAVHAHHKQNTIHRDLKPENILFDSQNIPKLVKSIPSAEIKKEDFMYKAPELLRGYKCDEKVDIWSLGIIFLEIISGKRIWQITEGEIPGYMEIFLTYHVLQHINDELLRDLFMWMLVSNPSKRINVKEVIMGLTEIQKKIFKLNPQQQSPIKSEKGDGRLRESRKEPFREQQQYLIKQEYHEEMKYGKGIFNYPKSKDRSARKTYHGEERNNQPDGEGEMVWNNGVRYSGRWSKGKKHGYGKEYYPDGDRYQGQWIQGRKHGSGIEYYSKGGRFEGRWKDGQRHGQGVYMSREGKEYAQVWKKGVRVE